MKAVVLDLAVVLLFATIGRASHAEGITIVGVLATALPFLVAALIGNGLAALRLPPASWQAGVIVWLTTWLLGMALRVLFGAGTASGFIVVAGVFLGLPMLGWRLVAHLAHRRSEAVRSDETRTRPGRDFVPGPPARDRTAGS